MSRQLLSPDQYHPRVPALERMDAQAVRQYVGQGVEFVGQGPGIRVEVWAYMADPTGIFLVSETPEGDGGPWLSQRMPAWGGAGKYHAAAYGLLDRHGESGNEHVVHSPGWRPEDEDLHLPYVVVLGEAGEAGRLTFAYDAYPTGPGVDGTAAGFSDRKVWEMGARPVGKPLYDDQGGPVPHGATERPCPRLLDQCWNNLEHLRHLRDSNGPISRALDRHWWEALEDWRGILGGVSLYDPVAS